MCFTTYWERSPGAHMHAHHTSPLRLDSFRWRTILCAILSIDSVWNHKRLYCERQKVKMRSGSSDCDFIRECMYTDTDNWLYYICIVVPSHISWLNISHLIVVLALATLCRSHAFRSQLLPSKCAHCSGTRTHTRTKTFDYTSGNNAHRTVLVLPVCALYCEVVRVYVF